MKFTIIDAPQGSAHWFAARLGRVTGSRAADALAFLKGGKEAKARTDLKAELLAEILTGQTDEHYTNAYMRHGVEQEPFARMAYEAATGLLVRETGFLSCDDIMAGASLDGDINDFEGITEFKCPASSTHVALLLGGEIKPDWLTQCIHNMWVSNAQWCDFVSYDPRMPEKHQLFIKRLFRNPDVIAAHESMVMEFLAELDQITNKLRAV